MKLNPTNTAIIKRLLVGRGSRPLRSILQRVGQPADIASLMMQLTRVEKSNLVDALISIQKIGHVLVQVPEQQLGPFLQSLDDEKIVRILQQSSTDDGSFLLQHIPETKHEALLKEVPREKREELLHFLNYPVDSAGRLMSSHFFAVPADYTAQQGIEFLREKAQEESIYYIYCTGNEQELIGVVSLRAMATALPDTSLFDLAKKEIVSVLPETPGEEVARLVSLYDFVALPVVDKKDRLVGIITVDDILDIIQEEATAKIYASAGLQESDRVYSPLWQKFSNRVPWMLLNLVLAGVASLVLYQFETILDELVILAVIKNIVTSSSGNTAIQTLTVMTRGLATDDFQFISKSAAISREVLVGTFMGIFTGLCAGIAVYVFRGDAQFSSMVAFVMLFSMMATSLIASIAGATVPILLKKLNRDPAVGSGVIVTVITDMFGFFSFLGLAALGLKYWS